MYIFSDAAKGGQDSDAVTNVREYIKSINGCKTVTIYESRLNKGLASSVIDGVSQILKNHDKIIVLEDDLISSTNFLDYMKQVLNYYQDNQPILLISGRSTISKELSNDELYYTRMASSLGWVYCKNRYDKIFW